MKNPLIVLSSSFFSYGLYILTSAWQPQTCRCLKLGFLLVHNSKGVFWTALLGTMFNKYMTFFKAYIHNDTGKHELLNILLTISSKVRLHLSDTLFCCGVLDIVYWAQIPRFSRNLANKPGCCPLSSYLP